MSIEVLGVSEVVSSLHRLGEEYPRRFIREATQELHGFAVKRASEHSKTGLMERSISLSVHNLVGKVFIENNPQMLRDGVNYGIFVHFGTRPHSILPKNKKALRWADNGVFHFAKRVSHPGYKGDPFLYDALKDTEKIIEKIARGVRDD